MRSKTTIEFLGLWEQLNNPDFKGVDPLLFAALVTISISLPHMFTALLKTDISSRATAHSLSTMGISLLPIHISQSKTDIASCEMVISLRQMYFALPTAVTDSPIFF